MITFNTNNNNNRESRILFHSILYLANEYNIAVDELMLYEIIKSKQSKIQINTIDNTLLLQNDSSNFTLLIHNVTIETIKKSQTIAKLRTSVDSIPM